MADSLAVQMQKAAKAKRAEASASEKTRIEALINQLGTFAWAEANAGRSYLQVRQSVTAEKPFYDAIITKIGIVYLANLGFKVESFGGGVANIWWEAPDAIQKEADAILNPPVVVTPPENTGPVTTPVTPV